MAGANGGGGGGEGMQGVHDRGWRRGCISGVGEGGGEMQGVHDEGRWVGCMEDVQAWGVGWDPSEAVHGGGLTWKERMGEMLEGGT